MQRKYFAAAAAFATVASFAAGSAAFAKTTTVGYADLDLSSAAGQARLEARIDRAARAACDASNGRQPLAQALAEAGCVRAARAGAMEKVAALRTNSSFGG